MTVEVRGKAMAAIARLQENIHAVSAAVGSRSVSMNGSVMSLQARSGPERAAAVDADERSAPCHREEG
ncbi:MAG TPA: hypothetical protein VFF72_04490 [Caldimonas sp.]|nr:hypothetical protein [Caldimonas sp.]